MSPIFGLLFQAYMDECRKQSTIQASEKQSQHTRTESRHQNHLQSKTNVYHFMHDYIFKNKKC